MLRSLAGLAALSALLLMDTSATQASQQKGVARRPWEWTNEERMAARFDPASVALRRAAAIRDGQSIRDDHNIVLGKHNPELFLSGELFDHLMPPVAGDTSVRAARRGKVLKRAAALRLPADFWNRLDSLTRFYFSAQEELRRLSIALETEPDEHRRNQMISDRSRIDEHLCQDRAAALAAARREFGRDFFDRFLYEAVAPDSSALIGSSTSAGTGDNLVWYYEEGCR